MSTEKKLIVSVRGLLGGVLLIVVFTTLVPAVFIFDGTCGLSGGGGLGGPSFTPYACSIIDFIINPTGLGIPLFALMALEYWYACLGIIVASVFISFYVAKRKNPKQ